MWFPPNLTVMAMGTGAVTTATAYVSQDGKVRTALSLSAPVTVRTTAGVSMANVNALKVLMEMTAVLSSVCWTVGTMATVWMDPAYVWKVSSVRTAARQTASTTAWTVGVAWKMNVFVMNRGQDSTVLN